LQEATAVVESWGEDSKIYSTSLERQRLLRTLYSDFVYRLDTNYAKIDRIEHPDIETFKTKVLNTQFNGKTIRQWGKILSSDDDTVLEGALRTII
jgi:hypothetical protein